ncbi:MAG: transcriptional regulator [Proteiniphilum sp.]|jgi:DNA-binding HxlR family transcriptional regulator|uniref:winged helix-turn-helix domain-containing protein n=1 Tax=Proteiniphilum sp. TaxID=1926877 RepID=UPI002B220872|nr:transcriptional regulator [Proteiniphilum sp.]MEA5127683.1 transcriptional regulator [Proteiniphilum sp.]
MIEHLEDINKAFESKVRLGIMSVLMVNEEVDFNSLKELLGVTDGNLASHTRALESLDYIVIKKQFVGRKPRTTFARTGKGEKAFRAHLTALESFLNKMER